MKEPDQIIIILSALLRLLNLRFLGTNNIDTFSIIHAKCLVFLNTPWICRAHRSLFVFAKLARYDFICFIAVTLVTAVIGWNTFRSMQAHMLSAARFHLCFTLKSKKLFGAHAVLVGTENRIVRSWIQMGRINSHIFQIGQIFPPLATFASVETLSIAVQIVRDVL